MDMLQTDACLAVKHQVPEIAKQLEIANRLKAIEILCNARASNFYSNDALDKLASEVKAAFESR